MKLLLLTIITFLYCESYSQDKIATLLSYSLKDNDTVHFCEIIKDKKGYSFVFPAVVDTVYDFIDNKPVFSSITVVKHERKYGPYQFTKKNSIIYFRDISRGKKYNELYRLKSEEFYAPDLFSSGADSYTIPTRLLDTNSILQLSNGEAACLKYLQKYGHGINKKSRILFIDKATFLPIRIEYFDNENSHEPYQVIMASK